MTSCLLPADQTLAKLLGQYISYVCHFLFTFSFSFILCYVIQCLASLWMNFPSVVVSEI